ncbi:MAG: leucine-rich repeat protein, partial [Mobilitalea sp.]
TGTAVKMEVSAKESNFTIEDGVLIKYIGSENEIVIPNGIKIIGSGAFKECTMEKVTIPDSVNIIENEAFQNCGMLTEIILPNSVKELGQSAFQGCSRLYRAELSNELYVNMSAFADCTSLKEVIIPDGVNTLKDYVFKNCTSLEMIDLPESINFIGVGCFENCSNLETILFPMQEVLIGEKAFYNTIWLDNYEGDYVIVNHTLIQYRGNETDITIPANITVIGNGAFVNCSFITNEKILIGVKEIGDSAFYGCSGLKEIVLPDSVRSVGYYAFVGCSSLVNITIPEDLIIRRNSLEDTKWMTDYQGDFIILNGNLLAYKGTASKVTIPDNVSAICTGAFSNNDIVTEVTVPTSVTKMYYAGFYNCNNLQKVFITDKNIYLESETFLICKKDLKLYGLPGGSVEDYAKRNNVQFVNHRLNKIKVTLYLDGNNITILRILGTEGKVQWQTEDSTIVNISTSGKATAVKIGSTKVKALVNGITMTCEITIKNSFISKKSASILVGRTLRLNIVGISSGLIWSSSDKSVATVNSKGLVTANQAGKTTITATIKGKNYICKVTVK